MRNYCFTFQNEADASMTSLCVSVSKIVATDVKSIIDITLNEDRAFALCKVSHAGTIVDARASRGVHRIDLAELSRCEFVFLWAEDFDSDESSLVVEVEEHLSRWIPSGFRLMQTSPI